MDACLIITNPGTQWEYICRLQRGSGAEASEKKDRSRLDLISTSKVDMFTTPRNKWGTRWMIKW